MRLIHTADLHLDSVMTRNLDRTKAHERRRELLETFVRMVEYASEKQVRAILIAGDMFDTPAVSKGTRQEVLYTMENHPQIDFLYLRGNHDGDGFLSSMDSYPANLKLFGPSWTSYRYGDVVITGAELGGANAETLPDSLILEKKDTNIVMLHGQLTGYASTGEAAETISMPGLKGRGIDYLALGHIHSYAEGRIDERGRYCYCGCPEGRGFDETGRKGFVLLDADGGEVRSTFIPFASRQIVEVPVDVSDALTTLEAVDIIAGADLPADGRDLVKLTLKGQLSPEADLDIVSIGRQFEDRYYSLRVKDETTLRINYEDYRYDHSLKGEFIRRVLSSGEDEEVQRQVIRCGLKALSGENIV